MGRALAFAGAAGALAVLAFACALFWPGDARAQFAPTCGPAGPFSFDSFELEDHVAGYATAIELAAACKAVTASYTVSGESVDVLYQGLQKGPRAARTTTLDKKLVIPATIYKSIVWNESGWTNADGSVPWGGVGPGLRSFDCGFGLGQVTTGMGNTTGTATAKQALVGTHFLFNLAEGVRILADKWNSAPALRPIAGNGDPAALEDWYYAIWSYNGFAFVNHPLNPNRDPLRPDSFDCGDRTAPGFGTFVRSSYTYQEVIYGCMKHPPKDSSGKPYWPAVTVDMPHLERDAVKNALDPENWSACADSFVCASMDFPTTLPAQQGPDPTCTAPPVTPSATPAAFAIGDVAVVAAGGTGLNLRASPSTSAAVLTLLPDGMHVTILSAPISAEGLSWVQVSIPAGTKGYVAATYLRLVPPTGDCPTVTLPAFTTHTDPTPAVSAGAAAALIGSPNLTVTGPASGSLVASGTGAPTTLRVTVANAGTFIAPFRIRTSAPWLVVHHPGDPVSRALDGGVAIGASTTVVVISNPRVTQAGYQSVLDVTLDASLMPVGSFEGTVWIDPLLGGTPYQLTIQATKTGDVSLSRRAVLPGVAFSQ